MRKYRTTTLWKLNFIIHLTDSSIYNILNKHKITRKRLRSKYYPEKREGWECEEF